MTKVLTEAQQVADFLIEGIEKEGGEKIDLIILYEGVAQGREQEHSDIDMCLLTSGETKYSWCFIWKERVVDAHSMTWEELEQLAKGNNWSWCVGCSKITRSKILWAKSEKYVRKLKKLAQKIPKGGEKLVQKAINEFNCVQGFLWQMQEVCEKKDTLSLAPLAWHMIRFFSSPSFSSSFKETNRITNLILFVKRKRLKETIRPFFLSSKNR